VVAHGKAQMGQQALEPELLAHARTLAGVEMRHGMRLLALEDLTATVVATTQDVATGWRATAEADFLEGCDRGTLHVRQAIGSCSARRGRMCRNASFFARGSFRRPTPTGWGTSTSAPRPTASACSSRSTAARSGTESRSGKSCFDLKGLP